MSESDARDRGFLRVVWDFWATPATLGVVSILGATFLLALFVDDVALAWVSGAVGGVLAGTVARVAWRAF